MIEIREQRPLASEARLVLGRDARLRRDHLERDGALRFEVEGSVDDADGAAADLALDREAPAEPALADRASGIFEHRFWF